MGRGQAQNSVDTVAVAIDKDKSSQYAIKWTVENILTRGQALTLLHVKHRTAVSSQTRGMVPISEVTEEAAKAHKSQLEAQANELFLPFRCFCAKKDLKCNEVIIEDTNTAKALVNYVINNSIDILVLGAPARQGLLRFRTMDVPSTVSKEAPDFCTVYVIGKGKVSSMHCATRTLPRKASSRNQIQDQPSKVFESNDTFNRNQQPRASARTQYPPRGMLDGIEIRSPFTRATASNNKSYELSSETDISFVSSGRPSVDKLFPSFYDGLESGPRSSISSDMDTISSTSSYSGHKFIDMNSLQHEFSSSSIESENSWSSRNMDEMEAEMRRLRLELKQTMDMYSTACKEALTAKQKAMELQQWKLEEERRLHEARIAEEAALALADEQKIKCMAAMEAAESAQRIAVLEAQKRRNAEMKALRETERKKALEAKTYDFMYRKYTIEEIEVATNNFSNINKIGEGGYGPVYRGELDHTPVAIKVLCPDAAQGRSQFQQEVQVLSCMRHPNMVLLLGACPEYGCLVYEYMANGSLEDRLFRRGNTPVIPWQLRFHIAAEIGTGLLFLHHTKPEPLVHRDLKPGNILLDHNYVSKISDVGLARLVPPSVADSVTQYHMTSTAGTFCYIDPEYQQTGMLGIKSDIYSLGVMFLQLITAKPPMGLTHHVQRAIENGTFQEMLDPAVPDWPVEEALKFAQIALQCAEMRRKNRPDLGNVVLPELNRLRKLAEDNKKCGILGGGEEFSPSHGPISTIQDVMSDVELPESGYYSSSSRRSSRASSYYGRN
ncbi:PREDICTED: U-box domain-containing protein 35 [Prunus mume]|uniref:RING-type E3 ubiquitin transferase n=1 Tax=Prunus mume TaxID=102107 RepID=A0ABM1LIE4_PRUMU|nr:PREDICTED: U-box domain-containing protein 35 [Prunus mume]